MTLLFSIFQLPTWSVLSLQSASLMDVFRCTCNRSDYVYMHQIFCFFALTWLIKKYYSTNISVYELCILWFMSKTREYSHVDALLGSVWRVEVVNPNVERHLASLRQIVFFLFSKFSLKWTVSTMPSFFLQPPS